MTDRPERPLIFESWRRSALRHSRADALEAASGIEIRLLRDGESEHIVVSGELDLTGTTRLTEEILRAEASDAREIVVDLTDLRFIDSAGMQVFIAASARSRADGADRLRIVRGPDSVHRPFEMSGLATRLPFVERDDGRR